jgi:hypothetical protein
VRIGAASELARRARRNCQWRSGASNIRSCQWAWVRLSEAHSAEFHCHVRVPSESGIGWAAADLQGASPRMTMGRATGGQGGLPAAAVRAWQVLAAGGCSAASGHPALSSRTGGGTSAGATSTHQSWHCGRRRAALARAGWGIQPRRAPSHFEASSENSPAPAPLPLHPERADARRRAAGPPETAPGGTLALQVLPPVRRSTFDSKFDSLAFGRSRRWWQSRQASAAAVRGASPS